LRHYNRRRSKNLHPKERSRVDTVFISDLVVHGIIGVNPWERETPQKIVINIEVCTDFGKAAISDSIADCVDYAKMSAAVVAHAESAHRFTVEALANDVAQIVLREPGVTKVRVKVEKPGAVPECRSVGVFIERPTA
jgi:FolB domain-containing protein